MRLDSVFIAKETSTELSGKCIYFVTVSVYADAVIVLMLLSVAKRPLNFMEMNNLGMTLVEYK